MVKQATKKITGDKNSVITVKNADGEPNTKANILIQNKINYVPKVSVIIPVYNVEQYLCECLDSVINQTLKEIEIICVDDGSTDNSLNILKKYAKKDRRITIITQENLHAGVARNAGLSVANGEYIHFLDSDDFINKKFYAVLVKGLENSKADFAYCSWTVKKEKDIARKGHSNTIIGLLGFNELDNNNKGLINVEIWNKLFRRNVINKYHVFFTNSLYGEDTAFTMRYLFVSKNVFGAKNSLYTYRLRKNSLMDNRLESKIDSYKSTSYVLDFLNKHKKLLDKNIFYFNKLDSWLVYYGLLIESPSEAIKYIKTFKKYIIDKIDKKYIPSKSLVLKIKEGDYQAVCDALYPEFQNHKPDKYYYDLQQNGLELSKIKSTPKEFKNNVDIVFILDMDYFLCSYVAITSLIHSKTKDTHYNINIVHTNLGLRQQKILTLLNTDDISINIIGFDSSKYDSVKKLTHITNTALIKFDIPNIFPNLDKILYIDGDILVQKDLTGLFNIDLGNNYIAATQEMQASLRKFQEIVGSKYYINSGVLLLNLKQMRKDKLPQKMIDKKMNQPVTWKCMDQDVFNFICDGRILLLGIEYNCTISIFIKRHWSMRYINRFYKSHYKSIEDMIKKSSILHFAGDYKPWVYDLKIGDITKNYMDTLNHSLMSYKQSSFKQLKQVPKKQHNTKPYILFPYYLFAVIWMKVIYIPLLKFVKHTKNVLYSHSYRGRMKALKAEFNDVNKNLYYLKINIAKQTEILNVMQEKIDKLSECKNKKKV